ncbi:MAG TPA: DUF1444 family protein, partial [Woeseiaceae bacterium]|nr:DUF1444 family protein [Woeseiaceae bacterium]
VAESVTSSLEPIDIARIVPVVKERAWLDDIRSALAEQGLEEMPEYVQVPLNDHLIVLYAEDTPTNIRYLEKETLGELEVPLADLGPMALENLRALLPEIEIMGGDGLYLLTAGGNYEASLLLYDELWTHQNFPVEGEIVVGLPTRDVLMVAGTAGGDGLERMRKFVKDAYEDGVYSLSPRLFVRRADRWVVYE